MNTHRVHARVHGGQARCRVAHHHTRARRHHVRRSSFRTGVAPRHHGGRPNCTRHRPRTHHGSVRRHPRATHTTATVTSGNCSDADLTPNEADLARIRQAVLCLVNRERTMHGEGPLATDARLEQAAQAHTEDMASNDYFEHVGPGGDTPVSRSQASGYIYDSRLGYLVGENIGWGTLGLATPRSMVAAWMASPAHRAIALDAEYRDTAVGVWPNPPASLADGQPGAIYTQDFGTIIAR
jgi:uncharacterized protein YkwD